MNMIATDYGNLHILTIEEIFQKTVTAIEDVSFASVNAIVGLTGGSTPKAFYKWAADKNAFSQNVLGRVLWSTSDERCVSLESDDSNFGHAERGMLAHLQVAPERKRPWLVHLTPEKAAAHFNELWKQEQRVHAFDLCVLGMGDDCHTASLFPHSSLISANPSAFFAAVEVHGKGWRLTLTPAGLYSCRQILIVVTGKSKTVALKSVFKGEYDPDVKPVQLLKNCANKVTWLVDPSAAECL